MIQSLLDKKNKIKLRYPAFWNIVNWWYYEWPMLLCFFDLHVLKTFIRNKSKRKNVLFYPRQTMHHHTIYKICHLLGYNRSNDPFKNKDLIVRWDYDTHRPKCDELEKIALKNKVLNFHCTDISKEKVTSIFYKVFGYNYTINPLKYDGLCVKKSNLNALHDGVVIKCPIDKTEEDFVYQKIINNQADHEQIMDIRMPIIGTNIPYVYLKYRPLRDRFSNENTRVTIADTQEIINDSEKDKILAFAKEIGLDFGEIDLARDNNDGKLYVLDVNNTPGGPPNHIALKDWLNAMKTQTLLFKTVFIDGASE